MSDHDHKVAFVYASHLQILLPSTFRLLLNASRYDALLKAFLDSAYRALLHEADAATAARSTVDGERKNFVLPDTFDKLGEIASAQDLRAYAISLTTLAQTAVVLASKHDLRDAMRGNFAAIWDPESTLTISLLQEVDVTCSLDLISKGIEMVRLACWLEYHLNIGYPLGISGAKGRFFFSGSTDDAAAVADRCRNGELRFEDTLPGIAIECTHTAVLHDLLQEGDGDKLLSVRKSAIPSLCMAEWTQLRSEVVESIKERKIKVAIDDQPLSQQSSPTTTEKSVNLAQLFSNLDFGRSHKHFQSSLDLLRKQCATSRVYTARIELLLLGASMRDNSAINAAKAFVSLSLSYVLVRPLDLLYPKDSHRFGDEPVKLSKVQGNPCSQIAVVGMSCRIPGADDAAELWELLKQGKDTCEEIPERLYRYQDYHSASYRERNVMRVKTGNFVASSGSFDKTFLGATASDQDCARTDPQQRVAILTAFETLQKAGYGFSPHRHPTQPEQWSTHLAYCSDDYREHLSQQVEADLVSNTHRAHLVAKINETFGFRGEACTYDTACSSALVAVEAACSSLLAGETSAVLTGGVNILTQPQITIGLDRGFFLSSSSQCMTLDDAGAGYSRADAVSIMLLKRLTDAVRDGDPILAVISSAATNHSGESFSITHPHGPTQERLYRSGMIASKTVPKDYSYIEMHGTGTQSGDLEEITGIVRTFGGGKREGHLPLILGSVKANVGHSEAASGATSIIKTAEIYKHGVVPRHIGIRTQLNTKLPPLDGFHIPLQEIELRRLESTFTLVDNFSAAGGNSSIVMDSGTLYRERLKKMSEEARAASSAGGKTPDDKHHLLFVTAATSFSLDVKRRRLIAFLEVNKDVNLAEFCSTVSLSDPLLSHRLIATPASISEVQTCLSSQESVYVDKERSKSRARSIGVAFSGQGAQYLDMARELYENSSTFRAHVDSCNTIALDLELPSLVQVIYPTLLGPETSGSAIMPERKADNFTPAQYQLAIVATEVGLASMLLDWGLRPSCVVGHSLGEYTALWLSGVLSLHSLIELVGRRAMLMMDLCTPNASSMLAVREGPDRVHQLLQQADFEDLEIACLNSPNDTVVAGHNKKVEELLRFCEQSHPKIKAMAIPVPYAFHSKAVQPLVENFRKITANHQFSRPRISIASNLFGKLISPDAKVFDASYLVRHLREPVRFSESISALQKKIDIDVWIEIGPHSTCTPMLKGCYVESAHLPEFLTSFRRGSSSWSLTLALVKELAARNFDLDWEKVFTQLGLRFQHRGLAAELPLYPFDLEDYWVPFKDRGLRDHLTVSSIDAVEGTVDVVEVQKPQRIPRPLHALLWRCVKLESSPPLAMFLARVNQRPFRDFIQGHIILGVPLAPATVFVEMAQEAGIYWWQADPCNQRPPGQKEDTVIIEVMDLHLVASLYVNERDPKQSVEVTLQGNPTAGDGSIVQFFSHNDQQHQQHQYGSCRIRIVTLEQATRDWMTLRHLVLRTASAIQAQPACMFKTDTIYKQFEAIVLYLDGFRGMNTIWLTERGDEAVSEITYNGAAVNAPFVCSPMLLDSLGGLTGFISNVSFAEGPFVYMAEAIGRIVTMPAIRTMVPGSATRLQVYARMVQDKDLSKGSAYFFLSSGELMGMMENIAFKRIRRDMLSRLVQLSSKAFASEAAKQATHENSRNNQASPSDSRSSNEAKVALSKGDVSAKPYCEMSPAQPIRANRDSIPGSPMDELTNPSRRFSFSAPLHIGGPQLKRFDAQNVLFVFPDGSGTAQALPKVETAGSLSVYGFDSPYLGWTGTWSRGIAELIDRYIELLYHVQSQGPYKLAGWSIGGIFAIEAAHRLLSAGHRVNFIGLIDTPSPRQIRPLAIDTLEEMLKRITSNTVREHFKSCALSLPEYRCQAFQETDPRPGQVMIVNATDDSKLKGVMANEPEWRSFWSSAANVGFHEVRGDHWSCLKPALDLVVRGAE